ncbi:protein FAM71D-like [Cygnus olor]|uniref:protein FAM71D-like n=1 Tax=Cygnus olor TaxID=8869 RepID=UPI001ADE560A|nr:protein FAM71D-like [Cygnus olor]
MRLCSTEASVPSRVAAVWVEKVKAEAQEYCDGEVIHLSRPEETPTCFLEVQCAERAMSLGPLKRLLRTGEFGILHNAPLFESDFFQVGCQGEMLQVTKRVHIITMGVACTDPSAGMPDTLLLAAPAAPPAEGLELTRLLPLRCVNLAVQDFSVERLQLCFHTGHRVYLQLCPGPGFEGLFLCWALLARMLHTPRAPGLLNTRAEGAVPTEEASSTSEVEEEDMTSGIVLPMVKASPCAEIDETSPAASTPEVIPEQTCAEHLSSNQDALVTSATEQKKLVCHRKGDRLREVPAAKKKPSSGRNCSQKVGTFWRRWWAHGRAATAGVAEKAKPPRKEQ